MIPIKTEQELKIMGEGGKRLSLAFGKVLEEARVGVRLKDLDLLAEKLIEKQGGSPSFKVVKGYCWTTCININQGVVHGIPNGYKIKEGDVLSLDMGILFEGFHSDMARTMIIGGKPSGKHSEFLKAGEIALKKAIMQARAGNRVGHITLAIEQEIKKAGFNPIESLTGHGVGRKLHEEPQIFGVLKQKLERTPLLANGMVLAIEVIYAQGQPSLILKSDGWTIETADGKLAGLFEDTVVLTEAGPLVLTPLESKLNF